MLIRNKYISVYVSDSNLRARNQDLAFLLRMSNLLSTSMNLKDLMMSYLSSVLEHFDLDAGRIYLMGDGGRYLNLIAHQGIDSRGFEKMHISEGFTGKSARTMSLIAQHISELRDTKRAAFLSSQGFKIVICVPMIFVNKVGGVMNMGSRKMIRLDQGKIDLLMATGNQIAVAVNNVKLHEDLQSRIKTLNDKKDMIKFFAYSISHDLKSPAIGIYGLTRQLQEKYSEILDEKGKAYCNQILKATKQMVALVKKINAYIETKEAPYNFEKIKVKEITKAIRDEFHSKLKERQIRWLEPDKLPEIFADRLALSRVFRNFVDNALKYGGKEMFELKIGYEENEVFHLFSFSDDGVGIKPKDSEKIFEQFRRQETSQGTAGSGLGLAIVKDIADIHGGQAWVDSSAAKGTTFYISISKALKAWA
ncbi:ATP-binding protein [Thermodesulfobacteriota bacterium]